MPGLYAWFFLNDWEGALLKKIKIFLSIEVLKFRFLKYFLLTVLGGGGGTGLNVTMGGLHPSAAWLNFQPNAMENLETLYRFRI